MSRARELSELWLRFMGDMLRARVPENRQRQLEDWAEALMKTSGVVPRRRYLETLEENERLRRRIADLENRLGIDPTERPKPSVETVFDDMLTAQQRWLETWMPQAPKSEDK